MTTAQQSIPGKVTRRKVKYGEARAKGQLVRALFYAPTWDAFRTTLTLLNMRRKGIR